MQDPQQKRTYETSAEIKQIADPERKNIGFRDLITWQKAYQLGLEVYRLSARFPKDELYALTSQMRRAVTSISANIAEGYERNHRKEYVQFLMIAKGSLGEVENYLLFARDLGYLGVADYNAVEVKRQEVGRLLRGLINSLRN